MSREFSKISDIVLFFFLVMVIGICSATPPLPCEYYGSVFIDNVPAPAGTQIIARINGIGHGEIITETAGFYGGPALFDRRLTVAAGEDELGSGTLEIFFEVNGIVADQKAEYIPGLSRQLDLTTGMLPANTLPTPSSEIISPKQSVSQPISGFENPVTYIADDGSARLSFNAGVQILADGNPVDQVEIIRTDALMLPPMPDTSKNTFTGYGYRVVPDGAVFIPQGNFIITIPPEELQGYVANFAVLKLFSPATGGWQDLNTAINTNAGEVQASVTWATAYALFEQNTTMSNNTGSAVPNQDSTNDNVVGTVPESGSVLDLPPQPPLDVISPILTPTNTTLDTTPSPVVNSDEASLHSEPEENMIAPQQGVQNVFSGVHKGLDTVQKMFSNILNSGKNGLYSIQQRLFSPGGYVVMLFFLIVFVNVAVFRVYRYKNKD